MIILFYNLLLLVIGILLLPKVLWQMFFSKKYRGNFFARLGFRLPSLPPSKKTIWIHAVSMGETRAFIPLYEKIKKDFPDATLIISSVTETGHREAKRIFPHAQLHFFLPLDFSWAIKKVLKLYRPDTLILVEGEFWYHLLSETKKSGASVLLVNGKISDRSANRFQKVPFFSRRLFKQIDRLCVQNKTVEEHFTQLGVARAQIQVTGNIKFAVSPPPPRPELKAELGITAQDRILVIASTHEGEEEALLAALPTIPHLKVLLVPRHPERFDKVAHLLETRQIPYIRYSQRAKHTGQERVILIDTMGLLYSCYHFAEIAIVGGSFITTVGGHNLFEPVSCGVPVLFGPHMFSQPDLTAWVLQEKAGCEVNYSTLEKTLNDLFAHNTLRANAVQAANKGHDVIQKTYDVLFPFLLNAK